MQDYQKLQIWQQGIEIAKESYKLAQLLPREELYGMVSQIKRASVSIPSNIAEGSSRKSQKDFSRFLEISLGSAFELETDFILAKELNLIDSTKPELKELMEKIERQKKMTYSFMSKL